MVYTTKLYSIRDTHPTLGHRLYWGLLFIGDQAGCAQAVKDMGLNKWDTYVTGLKQCEHVMLHGLPIKGKIKKELEKRQYEVR